MIEAAAGLPQGSTRPVDSYGQSVDTLREWGQQAAERNWADYHRQQPHPAPVTAEATSAPSVTRDTPQARAAASAPRPLPRGARRRATPSARAAKPCPQPPPASTTGDDGAAAASSEEGTASCPINLDQCDDIDPFAPVQAQRDSAQEAVRATRPQARPRSAAPPPTAPSAPHPAPRPPRGPPPSPPPHADAIPPPYTATDMRPPSVSFLRAWESPHVAAIPSALPSYRDMVALHDPFLSQASSHTGHTKTRVHETCLHPAVSYAASPFHSLSSVFAGVRRPSSQAAEGPTREGHAMRAIIKVTPFTPVSPSDAGPRLPPHQVLIPSHHPISYYIYIYIYILLYILSYLIIYIILCLMVLAATGVRPLPSKGRGPLDTGGEYFEAPCIRCIVSTTTSTTEHFLMTSAVTFFVYQIASAWEFCMPCTTWDWRSSQHPPPPQSTTWHHDVVQDGGVEANPGPHPTQQILSGSRDLGHPSGRITTTYPPGPQAGVRGPALPEPPNPARPWNDLTTIGDISLFLRSTASINTKVSSLVALHHLLLQQCHVGHNALPGEMHGAVLCTPPRDRKTAPSARASPTTDSTEVHSPGSPMTPTGGLDIECSRCGIRDFYSLCCSTCGDHLWGLDVHEGMAPALVLGLDVETDVQKAASSSTPASGTTSNLTGCAQRKPPPRGSPQPERPRAAHSPQLHVGCHMDQRPTANHGPQVPVHQCGDVPRQQDPIAYLIPSQTDTDDPD